MVVASLVPGCFVVGTEIGGSRAAARHESVDHGRMTGFAIGAAIDIAVTAVVISAVNADREARAFDGYLNIDNAGH